MVAAVLVGVASTAACGSSPRTATTTTTTTTPGAAGFLTIRTGKVAGSTALENTRGHTLYWYGRDKPGHIACTGSCLAVWRPFLLPRGDVLPRLARLGVEKRPGGQEQVTYKGSPLYTYSGDTEPGQSRGLRVPDWHLAALSST